MTEVWLKTQFPYVPSDSSLIEQMLYEGAIACAAKSVIPDFSDAMYFSFAPEQQEWIVQNENVAWQKYPATACCRLPNRPYAEAS